MCVSVCRTANIWNRVATAVCNSMVCDDQYRYLFVLHVLMHVSAISPSIHKQICRKCSAKSLSHLYKWSVALTDLTCSIKIIVATHFHQKIFIFSKNPWPHGRNQHQHATCAVSCRAICPAANTGLQHQVGIPTGPGPDDLGYRPGNPRHPMQAPACSSICIYN